MYRPAFTHPSLAQHRLTAVKHLKNKISFIEFEETSELIRQQFQIASRMMQATALNASDDSHKLLLFVSIDSFQLSKPSKMLPSTWKDADGFKLQFEANCPDSDKTFFVSQYPKIDSVAEKRLHCTTCDVHIGTAPIAEKIVRTHEVLGVTQCNKCHAFYVS